MRKLITIYLLCFAWVGLFSQSAIPLKAQNNQLQTTKEKSIDKASVKLTLAQAIQFQNKGLHDTASILLRMLLPEAIATLPPDTLLANIYHKLGVSQYYLGYHQLSAAIKNYQTALDIRRTIYAPTDPLIIKGYRNMGITYDELGKLDSAHFYLQKAIDLHGNQTKIDSALISSMYQYLGYVLAKKEDYNEAEIYLKNSYDIYQIIYVEAPWRLGEVYSSLFELYRKQKNIAAMKYYSKEAIILFENIADKYEEDYLQLADNYNNLGLAYYYSKDSLDYAVDLMEKALTINERFNESTNKAINLSNLSLIYRELKQFNKAIEVIEEAIAIDRQLKNRTGIATNINNKMEIFLAMKQYKTALETQHQAIQTFLPIFQNTNLLAIPAVKIIPKSGTYSMVAYLTDKAKILTKLATKEKQLHYLQATVETYDTIAILINQIRLDFESDKSKSFLTKKAHDIFDKAIAANIALYENTKDTSLIHKIFQLIEQSKAMIVLDGFAKANAAKQAGIPEGILLREKQLKQQLNQLEKEADLTTNTNNKEALIKTNRALEKLTDSLKVLYPKYAQLKYTPTLITATDLLLTDNQLMINYFVGATDIYVVTIDTAGINLLTIQKDFPLTQLISQLLRSVQTYHISGSRSTQLYKNYADTLVHTAHELYQKIMMPIQATTIFREQLIILPDGVLGYLPFDLLLSKLPNDNTLFGTHEYLLQDHQISYANSAQLLKTMQQKKHAQKGKNLLAFAPQFTDDNTIEARQIAEVRKGLGVLKHNKPEVEAIQHLIGGQIYTDAEATIANFIQKAPDYKILHLSTHGKANDIAGDYSFLAFTEIKDSMDNEILYNRDLYNLQLNADMVVLSACETGIGELQKGEGIISLARGFSYAGAKSIITTLWSVNDAKTKTLMESFYGYIKEGKTKDAALRQAKLDFMDNHPEDAHPFYWAAFVPIGDMSVIELNNSTYLWKSIGAFLILGLFYFFVKKGNSA